MKRINYWLVIVLIAAGCRGKNIPDVSGIQVNLQLQRFENDFFALDTTHTDTSLQKLHEKYPDFLQDFVFNILALPSQPDSNKTVEQQINSFITSYKLLKTTAEKNFADMSGIKNEVESGLRFTKYYFPDYKLPGKLITFIGPLNSYGNILTTDALAVGLQLYMGGGYPLYQSQQGQELYPAYISRRFSKEYIPVNCIKTIVNDLLPDNSAGKPLIEQMVEAGKRLYILGRLMPEVADTLTTGYTQAQLDGCYKNEQTIWSYFVQNDLLFVSDPSLTKDYMNDAPSTQAFGQESPGFIGQFTGWQIVKKWMEKNEKISLQELIKTPPKTIFDQAKYKP